MQNKTAENPAIVLFKVRPRDMFHFPSIFPALDKEVREREGNVDKKVLRAKKSI